MSYKMDYRTSEDLARIGLLVFLFLIFGTGSASVGLIGNNVSLFFKDKEANFAPTINKSGVCGLLRLADPLDACSSLNNNMTIHEEDGYTQFALIIRGSCSFDAKVRAAQAAGFSAAIIYNNEDNGDLVSMAGSSKGIQIYAVFVSKSTGTLLSRFADDPNIECWIISNYLSKTWSTIAIAFVSLVTMCAMLATCFFVKRHQARRPGIRPQRTNDFCGMSGRLVKQLPSMIFDAVEDDSCTSETCAICLEDYEIGDKLRVLPCHHKFHLACIDSWLTKWRTFCPMCKRDARTSTGEPPASESTPLLSPASTPASSAPISSFLAPPQTISRPVSFTGSPAMYIPNSHATSSYVISYSGPSRRGSSLFPPSAPSPISSRLSVSNAPNPLNHSEQATSIQPSSLLSRQSEDTSANSSPSASPPSYNSRHASSYIRGSFSASPQVSILYGRPPGIPSYSSNAFPSYAGSVTPVSVRFLASNNDES